MEKKSFAEMSVRGFAERLGSGEPTPGGGAAAALESALGAALIMMVVNHTIGKAKYAEYEELNVKARDEAEILRARLLDGTDRDAEAFGKVTAAYGMPRRIADIEPDRLSSLIDELRAEGFSIDDDGDRLTDTAADQIEAAMKARRSECIGRVSVEAAEVPLAVMEDSLRGLELAESILGRSNVNLVSDIYVAALSLSSGLKSASYNVDANLPAIGKTSPELAESMRKRSAEILDKADRLCAAILG